MLLCVCLNPAVDITYRLASALTPGASHRVRTVHERAGGKGINVARVARRLDLPVTVLALAGGTTGQMIRAELGAAGLRFVLTSIAQPSRRTVAVADPWVATVLNEAGPLVGVGEWAALLEQFDSMLDPAVAAGTGGPVGSTSPSDLDDRVDLVVLAGSLPPGVPTDAYRELTERAAQRGVAVIVDADGDSLRLALPARPFLVKPNRAELVSVIGGDVHSVAEIAAAGRELQRLGARNVVVSDGGDGLVAVTEVGAWRAVSPEVVSGNPTGAGDALVAALAAGVVRDRSWPDRLRDGIAYSAAAVACAVAGDIDLPLADRLAPDVLVEALAN